MLLLTHLALCLNQLVNICVTLAMLSLSPRVTDSLRIAALSSL